MSKQFQSLPKPLVGPVEGRNQKCEWRGLMIDSARTRFEPETIIKVLELASRYGFNKFHWHLTNDAGWRFHVPEYPLLTEVSAYLPRNSFDDYTNLYDDTLAKALEQTPHKWSNGYYTDEEIRRTGSKAEELGIEIIPEVDLPGHMMAAIRAYPRLGRPEGLPLPEGSMREHMWWPARNDLLWPTDEAAQFIRTILNRIMDLLPSRWIHVGGDECAYKQWESDPNIDSWLERRDVDKVESLQNWFMEIAKEEVRGRGRQLVAWDEVAEISDDPEILIIAWDEDRAEARMDKVQNPLVCADARFLYLNRVDPNSEVPQKGMLPGISVDQILTAPLPMVSKQQAKGIQTCLWSEFILDESDLMSMMFPRFLAVAERIWNPDSELAGGLTSEKILNDAKKRVAEEYRVLQESGIL